jgi:hypothetical protein
MGEDNRRPLAPQGSADFGPLDPFLILRRRDDSLAVAARAPGNVISIAPLRIVPDPPRRRLLICPCCQRPFVISEWPNGTVRLTPLPKSPDDDISF